MKKLITAVAATLIATSAIAAPVGGSYQDDGGWTGQYATDHVTKTNLSACYDTDQSQPMLTSGADVLTDHAADATPLCNTDLTATAAEGR